MRVDNGTHWRSDHLLRFARRAALDELDPEKRKRYVVRFRYGRSGPGTSGHAPYNGFWCQVNLASTGVDRVDLAHTLAHEMAHSRGMRHPQMRGSSRYRRIGNWSDVYAWAETLPLETKPAPRIPTVDERRAKRLAHAEAMLTAWEQRLKTAASRVRRWRGRVRDTRRYIALAASRKGET